MNLLDEQTLKCHLLSKKPWGWDLVVCTLRHSLIRSDAY